MHYPKVTYYKSIELRIKKNASRELSQSLHGPDPEISAVTLTLKKFPHCKDYRFLRNLITTKVCGEILTSEFDLEYLQLNRFFASIRALEYNCTFVHKLMSVKDLDSLNDLSSLYFSYRNETTSKALASNSSQSQILLTHSYICDILQESINLIEYFESKINYGYLSNNIKNFKSLYNKALAVKKKKITLAKTYMEFLRKQSGQEVLKSAYSKINGVSLLNK